jgi:hypothetical protein
MSELTPGRLLQGKYRVERKLGGGGMGEIYLAALEKGRGGARRAMKRLYAYAANEQEAKENLELFASEAEVLAQLSHPSIPQIFERFAEDGDYYIAMEFVEGSDCAKARAATPERRLAAPLAIHILRELASVLAYLHRQRPAPIVYRDLKPQNVMLTPANRVVLVDFGIARRGGHDLEGPPDRPFFATEEYCAPEALAARRTTPRSDIFALGMTIAELLTGCEAAELRADSHAIREIFAPPALSGFEWLADLLDRCMARDARRRFAHGDELLAALVRGAPPVRETDTCPECRSPARRAALFCDGCGAPVPLPAAPAGPAATTAARIEATYTYAETPAEALLARATSGEPPEDPHWVALAQKARALDVAVDYGELKTVARLRFSPLPHQIEAVRTALRDLRGRALLADEVGLGKTIEALMVTDELRLRGLVKRVLVLTPTTLVSQWIAEITDKFGIPEDRILELRSGAGFSELGSHVFAVGSYDVLKRVDNREPLLKASFDLIIVDEVQNLLSKEQNKTAPLPRRGYELVSGISKKYVLLLSATPIQNTIVDLYEIVNLLRPGQLMRWSEFAGRFIAGYDVRQDGRRFPRIRRGEELRKLLTEVVIRNTRDRVLTTGRFPRRTAARFPVRLSEEERELYERLRIQISEATAGGRASARVLELAEALSSSPAAFVERARARGNKLQVGEIAARAEALGDFSSKLPEVRRILDVFVRGQGRKAIIFSHFAASRRILGEALAHDYDTRVFHRGVGNVERLALLRAFERSGEVLVVDDSAAVGLNLQFCDLLINFDLPWNPFLIEQRIGRVQRIGQRSEDVVIANLQVLETIDEVKLDVCEAKLKMFEGVFGSAPTVLGALQEQSIEEIFHAMYLERDVAALERRREDLERSLGAASQEIANEERLSEAFFDAIGWKT